MPYERLIVLKFGGSVLTDRSTLGLVVREVRRWRAEGWNVVAVVSALGGVTDDLLETCRTSGPGADPHVVAAVLATGEQQCASLLALRLAREGVPASVFTPGAVGLGAWGHPLDAVPVSLDRRRLCRALDRGHVIVFPGFTAVDPTGRTVVLGRGGSDLTAIFLAHQLRADRCRLIKDVDGLYERDPAADGPKPRRYEHATWDDALGTDGSIVQHKAVFFAREHNLPFELTSIGSNEATLVGAAKTRLVARKRNNPRVRRAKWDEQAAPAADGAPPPTPRTHPRIATLETATSCGEDPARKVAEP